MMKVYHGMMTFCVGQVCPFAPSQNNNIAHLTIQFIQLIRAGIPKPALFCVLYAILSMRIFQIVQHLYQMPEN